MEDSTPSVAPVSNDFYLRYYNGHNGHFGHEFIEFEIRKDGLLRYANNSSYKKEHIIRKEVCLNTCVVEQFKQILQDSCYDQEDDENWPEPNADGRQELEVKMNGVHSFYVTCKINSASHLNQLNGPENLAHFYYLSQDLKAFVFSLINLHFKLKPI